jgi:cyclopropane fatty-acyl-phospholipid synthase-like methyltransferase
MTDWITFWNSESIAREENFLRQVARTVNGLPISEESLEVMVRELVERLQLNREDRVLDLCCGNGIITFGCAEHCSHITGVDFSRPLIDTASKHFARENITYAQADARDLPPWLMQQGFSKVYMHAALQYFSRDDAEGLLVALRQSPATGAPIFFASVPDRDRIWNFYDTPLRREEYMRRVKEGTEAIGQWWSQSELADVADKCGYAVEFTVPNALLDVAHYRFDALCRPRDRNA